MACFTKPNLIFKGKRQGRYPHVEREGYGPRREPQRGKHAPLCNPPNARASPG